MKSSLTKIKVPYNGRRRRGYSLNPSPNNSAANFSMSRGIWIIRREGLKWDLAVRFGFGGLGSDLVQSVQDTSDRSMLVIAGVLREEKMKGSRSNKSRQCPELWLRDTSEHLGNS